MVVAVPVPRPEGDRVSDRLGTVDWVWVSVELKLWVGPRERVVVAAGVAEASNEGLAVHVTVLFTVGPGAVGVWVDRESLRLKLWVRVPKSARVLLMVGGRVREVLGARDFEQAGVAVAVPLQEGLPEGVRLVEALRLSPLGVPVGARLEDWVGVELTVSATRLRVSVLPWVCVPGGPCGVRVGRGMEVALEDGLPLMERVLVAVPLPKQLPVYVSETVAVVPVSV